MTAAIDWSAHDETGITGSEITVATDGAAPAKIAGTTFPYASAHTYIVTVRVRDAAGHWSAWASTDFAP
jgi:hypothetical protein